MKAISLRTPIPGPKSEAFLARHKVAAPQGLLVISDEQLEEGLAVIEKQLFSRE